MGKQEVDEHLPLFETRKAKGRIAFRLYVFTIFVGFCMILSYRITHIPKTGEPGRWAWIGLLMADLWFLFYWIITQSVRLNVVYRQTFKERLSQRYGEKLPRIDIFVCTADPIMEPPTLVINTVLSVMAYDYPPEKLSIYLSDDGGSDLTFYALLEASRFSKHWIPFCKKFGVEPRSPAVYFAGKQESHEITLNREWLSVKVLYEEMKNRIERAVELGRIPGEIKEQHKGFLEWNSKVAKKNHHTILQILIDGRNPKEVDVEGHTLPTLVYLAREKRPQYHHNFKAGALNALIRVSSVISNAPVILNVDCDMYSNNPEAIKDALCFLMDEKEGHQIAYIQFPQSFDNNTKNDLYGNELRVVNTVELPGMDGFGGTPYCGTGCFHRRESLSGMKYTKDYRGRWDIEIQRNAERNVVELEDMAKVLANCSYEENTLWGKEMGLMYGNPVEDFVTGLAINCRGWKSILYHPHKRGFLGVAPTTLDQSLVQHKRWSEGMFQIFLSKFCPFIHGHGKIKLGAQMGYSVYILWAPNSFPTLFYVVIPSLCFLNGIPLFPKMSSAWFLPFAYVFIGQNVYSIIEAISCGDSLVNWWNLKRMWILRKTSSYLFSFMDIMVKKLGFGQVGFSLTTKVADDEALKRYQQDIMDFGTSSPMFTVLSTIAMLNIFSLIGGFKRLIMNMKIRVFEEMISQIVICGLLVILYIPIYEALFIRKDKGRLPASIACTSIVFASLACLMPMY